VSWGRVFAAVGVVLATAVAATSAGGAGTVRHATLTLRGSKRAYLPGQVVVRFRENVDSLSRRQALSAGSASTVKPLGLPGLQLVRVKGSVPAAIAALKTNPAVAYAEPNWIYRAQAATPNDPRYSQLWGLAKINAPSAWNTTTGSTAVKVAVVDTGIATDHLDLSANVVPGYDFVQGDSDPRDFNGHGTHVAGTIGARGNNGIGVTGVDWQVSLMPVRVLDGSGSGSNANVAAGFAYACSHGASIVNASLGGTGYSDAMRDAIAACPNTLFVVAAGNDGANDDTTPHYPCNYGAAPDNLANVICVAATDQNDVLAGFSNYGHSVDLAAPGVNIPSTWPAYDTLASEGFEDPFASWDTYTAGGFAFGRSTTHANGAYSAADSPAGSYAPNTDTWLHRTSSMASLAGRVGCRLSYNLRLDTESSHDYFRILGSADGVNFGGSQWSGSTNGSFVAVSSDMSAFDGAGAFFPALRLTSDADSVTGDGGYVDDLTLQCLRANAEDYNTISGTSMATPHVTGVAALVKAEHPSYTVAQLKNAILGGVDRVASLNGKVATGGRLDACKAVGGCGASLKPPCVVPNVVGKKLAAAKAAVKGRHCKVGHVGYLKSTGKKKGRVIRQSPAPGRHLGSNAAVKLWLGRGH
jgi:subtilisin family serine protease